MISACTQKSANHTQEKEKTAIAPHALFKHEQVEPFSLHSKRKRLRYRHRHIKPKCFSADDTQPLHERFTSDSQAIHNNIERSFHRHSKRARDKIRRSIFPI